MKYLICLLLLSCKVFSSEVYIIGISGGTCSGKTHFAQKVVDRFAGDVLRLPQDAYYKNIEGLTNEERRKLNYDHPDSIDFELLIDHLSRLVKGEEITIPNYSYFHNMRLPGGTSVTGKKVILLDGHLIYTHPKLREILDLRIYLDTGKDLRSLRRVQRDLSLDRDFGSIFSQCIETLFPMHEIHVEPTKEFADIIIPGGKCNDIGIDLLCSKIREYL